MSAGRLTFLEAAWVVARRDFVAVLFSRAFLFFLLGPLFPLVIGIMAGGVTRQVSDTAHTAHIGVAMPAAEAEAMLAAHHRLAGQLGPTLPEMRLLKALEPGATFDARAALAGGRQAALGAVLTGTRAAPVLTGPKERIDRWRGAVALVADEAGNARAGTMPPVALEATRSSSAQTQGSRLVTAQGAQTLLFLLIMLLAGMVLSNLVEEKTNKIIEVLAAAIPMDAVFCGKLFAMLGVSLVGIAVWGVAGGAVALAIGQSLPVLAAPAVGWPMFFVLGTVYFAMGYLLLGAIFLTIGSMAATVREVQTLSMPVTMMQLLVFFFASFAMTAPGSTLEHAAIAFPLSSPFAMLARAAREEALWPHALAIGWQVLAVALIIRDGAALFRRRVMQSGPAKAKRSLFGKRRAGGNTGS